MTKIDEIKKYLEETISLIDDIKDKKCKVICVFCLIEAFAQTYNDYKTGNADGFEKFILAHTKDEEQFKFLDKIDIVTLYYANKEELNENNIYLESLEDGYEYTPKKIMEKEIYGIIAGFFKDIEKTKKHSYSQLLYKQRSKLVHEFVFPSFLPDSMVYKEEISYMHINEFTNSNAYWTPIIPYGFLKKLAECSILNFLKWCEENNKVPFIKKEYHSWQEKQGSV